MAMLHERLPQETAAALRQRAGVAEMLVLPADTPRPASARAANAAYHARQRALGAAEMEALLQAAGFRPPLAPADLTSVLISAVELFLRADGIEAEATVENGAVAVRVLRCPVYDRFADPTWHGVTACGCFARRQGWYDALETPVSESLLLNRKWDDPICHAEIRLQMDG